MTAEVFDYFDDSGRRTAIRVTVGRKYDTIVVMTSSGVRTKRIKKVYTKYLTPLEYPPKRAIRAYLAAGKRLGITKGAKQALRAEL